MSIYPISQFQVLQNHPAWHHRHHRTIGTLCTLCLGGSVHRSEDDVRLLDSFLHIGREEQILATACLETVRSACLGQNMDKIP